MLVPNPKRPPRAFFCAVLLVTIHAAAPAAGRPAESCNEVQFDNLVQISRVIDGDTVIDTNGQTIRLIGLDAPEINHNNLPRSEPGAVAALNYLQALIARSQTVGLIFDTERFDHYNRLLAHLFFVDGTSIQGMLLAQGHAVPLIVPPNLAFVHCYRDAAQRAFRAKRGLWRLPAYQPREAGKLSVRADGYRVITGKIMRVGESKSSLWINLDGNFALRIHRDDLDYFDQIDFTGLVNQAIRVQGRVYRQNRQWRMRIRHPFAITIVSRQEGQD